jgi:hypothetical protein
MPHLVHNEKTKLSATMFNTLAVASIVVGFITPVVTLSMRDRTQLYGAFFDSTLWIMLTWIAVGAVLHWFARSILGRLQE